MKDGKVTGEVSIEQEWPVFLAFLKRMDDGRFEPVTGHYDSGLSFRTYGYVKNAY